MNRIRRFQVVCGAKIGGAAQNVKIYRFEFDVGFGQKRFVSRNERLIILANRLNERFEQSKLAGENFNLICFERVPQRNENLPVIGVFFLRCK